MKLKLPFSLLLSFIFLLTLGTISFGQSEESGSRFDITGQWLELSTGFERNRTLGDSQTFQTIYRLHINDHYHLQSGFSYQSTQSSVNALFLELGYERIADSNFSVMLKFLGNQYAEYDLAANSIIGYLKWERDRIYLDLGINHRFLNTDESQLWNIFHYQTQVHEVKLYYNLGCRVYRTDNYCAAVEITNFTPTQAGNTNAFALFFKNSYSVSEKYRLFAELGLYQTGSAALSANYYKTTLRGGVEVKL